MGSVLERLQGSIKASSLEKQVAVMWLDNGMVPGLSDSLTRFASLLEGLAQ